MARKINPGETLSGIAAQNNTTVDELMKLNPNITNPNVIKAGDYINLPGDDSNSASAGSESLSNNTAQGGTSLMKSNVSGISDERYTQLNQKLTDYSAYQNATQLIQQAYDNLKGGTKYQQDLEDVYNQFANRKDFSYDFSQDPLFMNMLEAYQNQGQMAMQDTIAQSSALTGGYANSWAQTAGQQSYNQHLQEAYNNLPEYYQSALNAYNMEGDKLQQMYSMLSDLDKTEYDRMVNDYNMANDYANRAASEFENIMGNTQYLAGLEQSDWQYKDNKATAAANAKASAEAELAAATESEIKTVANSMKAALDRGGEEELFKFMESLDVTDEVYKAALERIGMRSDFYDVYDENHFNNAIKLINSKINDKSLTARQQVNIIDEMLEKYKWSDIYSELKRYYGR